MKLATRFFISHSVVVVLSLLIVFFLVYGGARSLYQRQSRLGQMQQLSNFALAAKESMIQHEDVGLLAFMRSALKNPALVFAAYSNSSTGIHLVLPETLQKEVFPAKEGYPQDKPVHRSLSNGQEVVQWTAPLSTVNGESGRVWLAYSQDALDKDLRDQTDTWLGLGLEAGAVALLIGLLLSLGLGRHLALPLRKIRDGTKLVRSGKLNSLVEVNRRDEVGDLARDFNSMVVQLKELDAMKRDFMSGVTHDLGTPLHAIRSAINFLQAGDAGPLTEKQSEYLLMVSNSTSNLTAFINNLLTTARIEAAKVDPYFEPVDVFAHVKELVDLYQPQAQERGLKLALVKKTHYISLMADVVMFRQIVLNLLSNALKFTPRGEVDVILSEAEGHFVLEVADTGIGIDPQFHQLIFEKFYRVHQPAKSPVRQGSGLGLSIVKGLAEAHGGNVSVQSTPGTGSTFKVVLPKQPPRYSR